MKITVESTQQFVDVEGVQCRLWRGQTERGVHVNAMIRRIAAASDQDLEQLDAELNAAPDGEGMYEQLARGERLFVASEVLLRGRNEAEATRFWRTSLPEETRQKWNRLADEIWRDPKTEGAQA